MADKITESIIKLSAEVDEYVGDMNRAAKSNDALAKSADDYAKAEDKKTKVTRQGRDELQQLEARYNQRLRLEEKLRNEQEKMQRITAKGTGSEEDRARVFSLVEGSIRRQIADLDKQEAAMRKSATSTGLARYEMINLSRQIQDVGVSLAGGQSPFRILVEQGSQIADIFISSKATVKDFFVGIGQSIASLGTRAAAFGIAGVVTALVVGASAAALAWASAQKDVELALLGIGRASGATAQSINQIAKAGATTFGLSISEAREFASILAQTGQIGVDKLAPAVAMGRDLAIVLGTNSTQAAKVLAQALAEPGKGIEQLNQSLGEFDAATVRHVQNLVAQNKISEAQKVIMGGVANATRNAQDAVSNLTSFWTALGNVISNAADAVGEYIAKKTGLGQSSQQELEGLIHRWNVLHNRIETLGDPFGIWSTELAQVQAKIGLINSSIERTALTAEEAARKLRSMADQKLVRGAVPEIAEFENIRNQAIGVNDLMARINATGGRFSPILKEIAQSFDEVELAASRTKERMESWLSPAQRATAEFQLQIAAITARTSAERQTVAMRQAELQAIQQGASADEKALAIERARVTVVTQLAAQHRDNMAALNNQLAVAKALPGHAQQVAQYEADINARLREGATLMQAEEEAATKRAIAVQQANNAVDQQIISLRQGVEMERARLEGTEAATAAAQAYANAMRSGASETKAAALAAETLAAGLEKAQIAAEKAANNMASMSEVVEAAKKGDLGAKLALVGTGERPGSSFSAGTGFNYPGSVVHRQGAGGSGPSAAGAGPLMVYDMMGKALEQAINARAGFGAQSGANNIQAAMDRMLASLNPKAAIEAQQNAAQAAQDAARAQQSAAESAREAAVQQAEAARAAREAFISKLDEAVKDIVATKLLAGQSAQAVNMLIEQGGIKFGTSSTRFQTQMDLYKRAGASNAQIAADIRAGIIGEGARPSEILAALDSLTEAVNANTDAQLGLSPFYTSQGDRQLGYRGYTVQKGASNIPGAGTGGISTGGTGGIPGTGGGGVTPIGGGGIMGGVVNPPTEVSYESQGPTTSRYVGTLGSGHWETGTWGAGGTWTPSAIQPTQPRIVNNQWVTGHWTADGQWVTETYGAPIAPAPTGQLAQRIFAEGGIVDRPTQAVFGEAGPEAFVPLKGGAIPVRLMGKAANDDKPTTVININAPLVHFAAEPTRDEVRESAYQASQMLRRQMAG